MNHCKKRGECVSFDFPVVNCSDMYKENHQQETQAEKNEIVKYCFASSIQLFTIIVDTIF